MRNIPVAADVTGKSYIDLAMIKSEFQVVINGLIGDLAEQREIRHSNLLFLRGLEHGLLDLRPSSSGSSTIAYISGSLGATKTSTLLFSTNGTSRVTLRAIATVSGVYAREVNQ